MSVTAQAQAEVGPMVCGFDIEDAVNSTLQAWLPAYLTECERLHGWDVGATPRPRGWAVTGRDLQKLNSDQLPCIVLMAGGIVVPPTKEGPPGKLTAFWALDVGVVFSASWGRSSRRHAQLYAAAIRTVLAQRPLDTDLQALAVDVRGEVYDEIDFADSRTYSASVCSFNVEVRNIGWTSGGPPPLTDPPEDPTVPWEPWVRVREADASVEQLPLTEQ